MTRFSFKGDVTWGAGGEARSFSYATENQQGFDAFLDKAIEAVSLAEEVLDTTITHLNAGPHAGTAEVANRYFLTGETLEGQDLRVIKTMLITTRTGMKSSLALKVQSGPIATYAPDPTKPNETKGGAGYTASRGKPGGSGPRDITKPYHNHFWHLRNRRQWRAGAIHIGSDRLNDKTLGCKTIIHEATHKYAGTEDYCYFEDDGVTVRPQYELRKKHRALDNADSYAWFAVAAWWNIESGNW